MSEKSMNVLWSVPVAVCILAALMLGFFIGFVVGDQRILLPEKDQLLLSKGALSQLLYENGVLQEGRGVVCEAWEIYEKALAHNPYLEDAREALQRLSTPKNCK